MKKLNEYIEITQAADLLGVSKVALRKWEKDGIIKVRRHPFSNFRLYDKEELEEILRNIESNQ